MKTDNKQGAPFAVAIGRQLGAGGREIAERLAKALRVALYDRRLIELAAEEQGFESGVVDQSDEVAAGGWSSKLLRAIGTPFASLRNIYDNPLSHESQFGVQADLIRRIAGQESAVFVGRCSDYILRNHPRHVSVFVMADMADRVSSVSARMNISEAAARELIEKNDRQRAAHHDLYAETTWAMAPSYDLCVNVSRVGIDGAVEIVERFVRHSLGIGDPT